MTDENSIGRNALSAGALMASIVLGIVLYLITGEAVDAFGAIMLVFGAYMAIVGIRTNREESFGPSAADGVLAGGAILAGLGIVCFLWAHTGDVMVTAFAFIVIVAAIGMLLAHRTMNLRPCLAIETLIIPSAIPNP